MSEILRLFRDWYASEQTQQTFSRARMSVNQIAECTAMWAAAKVGEVHTAEIKSLQSQLAAEQARVRGLEDTVRTLEAKVQQQNLQQQSRNKGKKR